MFWRQEVGRVLLWRSVIGVVLVDVLLDVQLQHICLINIVGYQ